MFSLFGSPSDLARRIPLRGRLLATTRTFGFVSTAALLLACGGAPSPSAPTGASEAKVSDLERGRQAAEAGDWQTAARLLERATSAGETDAHQELVEVLIVTGDYDRAARLAGAGGLPLLEGRALRARGQLEAAIEVTRDFEPEVLLPSLKRDLLLGEMLLEAGTRPAAEEALFRIIAAYNDGSIDALAKPDKARALGLVGRAAHLLRSPEDANAAFNEAEEIGWSGAEMLRHRAELFIDKHDYGHAGEVLEDAQKAQPRDPNTLVLLAELEVGQALAFEQAERLAERSLAINPQHTGAHAVLAGVALRDMALDEAEAQVKAGLAVNPRDLTLLSMRAAKQFLAEDQAGFERTVEHVLELSPGYAKVFRTVATYAEWEHRYEDIERLMRRAARIDPEDAHVRAMLGLTLVRSGSDAAGVVALRRAFDLDPYNVRVLNTLDLYEKVIPKKYVDIRKGPFSFRFPKDERKLLERYVPALAETAHQRMVERYGFSPPTPVGIELYATRDQFAVRTSGLPRTAIQGVCFGRKLATVTPAGSPGNLGMTLWHELSHVFHITLSNSRVPRWFTEGMAEWETEHLQVGWSRELDRQLYGALQAHRLPHLGRMSHAFTRAERMSDIATAYYASGRIVDWIIDEWGQEAAVNILRELGQRRLPVEVIPEVLGKSHEHLDEMFRDHLGRELRHFDSQFVPDEPRISVQQANKQLKGDPKNLDARVALGQALLAQGKPKRAEKLLRDVLSSSMHPQAAYSLARILMAKQEREEALKVLQQALSAGHDGFEVRMRLARILLADEQEQAARKHLQAATKLDPTEAEPWAMLAGLARQANDEALELEAVSQWAMRSEHEAPVHRRHLQLLVEQDEADRAAERARWAVWADLGDLQLHRWAAAAYAAAGQREQAEFEWESALLCEGRPKDKKLVLKEWAGALEGWGQTGKAARILQRSVE